MAELILKIGDSPTDKGYKDGDVVDAFNSHRIQRWAIEDLCSAWESRVTDDGLYVSGSIAEDIFKRTHEFKYERIAPNTVRRTNLITLDTAEFGGDTLDPEGNYMNVRNYVNRQFALKAPLGGPNKPFFGVRRSEVWYGGSIDYAQAKIDLVWDDIEAKTAFERTDFTQWPLGSSDVRHFLAVPVDEFDDAELATLVARVTEIINPGDPEEEHIEETVKMRSHFVTWRDITTELGTTEADVLNRDTPVDKRDVTPLVRADIVEVKA